jgi:hypothetical protein
MSNTILVTRIDSSSVSDDGKIVFMKLTFQNGDERTYALPSKELAAFTMTARREMWTAETDQVHAVLPSNLKFQAQEGRHSLLISFNLSENLPIHMEVRLQDDLARLKAELARLP